VYSPRTFRHKGVSVPSLILLLFFLVLLLLLLFAGFLVGCTFSSSEGKRNATHVAKRKKKEREGQGNQNGEENRIATHTRVT